MAETLLLIAPLMRALKADTPAKLARLTGENLARIQQAIERQAVPAEEAYVWCAHAGVDPSRVWPIGSRVVSKPIAAQAPALATKGPTLPAGVEWVEDLPPQRADTRQNGFAESLRGPLVANAGRWAKVATSPTSKLAVARTKALRRVLGPSFEVYVRPIDPKGPASAPHAVYVRYVEKAEVPDA